MHIIVTLALGLAAGALARLLAPSTAPGVWLAPMAAGVLGVLLVGFLGRAAGASLGSRSTGGSSATLAAGALLVVSPPPLVRPRSPARS